MAVSPKQGLDDPEILAKWEQAAGRYATVERKLERSAPTEVIVIVTMIGAVFYGLLSLTGFLGSHTGTYSNGVAFDHTAKDMACGYTFVALAVGVIAVGAIFYAIAKKNREEIARNPHLLDALIQEQQRYDRPSISALREKGVEMV